VTGLARKLICGWLPILFLVLVVLSSVPAAPAADETGDALQLVWDQKIPMRDGVKLSAVIWKPRHMTESLPAIVTITPYGAQRSLTQAKYFATHGYVLVAVDSRGRGNSEGSFRPFRDDGADGYDIVEWAAKQPWCNGKVGTWGGSYSGFNQWATMKYHPPDLKVAIPFASGGVISDIPMFNNIVSSHLFNWLTLVSGRIMNSELTGDDDYWEDADKELARQGKSFRDLEEVVGNTSTAWKEMLAHPTIDDYWLSMIPSPQDYQKIDIPILTVTGHYDGDQGGALMYYRDFMQYASPAAQANHYLIIGPWDHHGTLYNKDEVGKIKFGPNAVLNMIQIHLEFYDWALKGKEPPKFLKDKVAYYVAGRDEWRYSSTLSGISDDKKTFYLSSEPLRVHDAYHAGYLSEEPMAENAPDVFASDPGDLKALLDEKNTELYFYTPPLEEPLTMSGVANFDAYIAIDRPDADFSVKLQEVMKDGTVIPLAFDAKRARYNHSLRAAELVKPGEVNQYVFSTFHLFSRQLAKGSRLRISFSVMNTSGEQRNMNTGGPVSEQTIEDAKPVQVTLYHDRKYPSRLVVPVIR